MSIINELNLNKYRYLSILLAVLLGMSYSKAEAVNNNRPIDAGQLLSELEPERHILPEEKSTPEFDIEMPKRSHQSSEETILVKQVEFHFVEEQQLDKITNAKKSYSKQSLDTLAHSIVDKHLGGEISFNNLVKLAEQVTEAIRSKGYPTTIVYMPKQDMHDATLTMNVILGSYDSVSVDNHSMVDDERMKGYVHAIQSGDLIYVDNLNRQLLIINDLAGVRAKASLMPGDVVGTAKLEIDAENLEKQGAAAYVDNYGSQSTGRYRYGIGYHYNNIAHMGDQLQGNYVTSNLRGMDNYSFQYEIPVGRDGAKVRTSFSRMTYDIFSDSKINYNGNSKTLEFGTTIPMSRTFNYADFVDVAYRHRWIEDDITAAAMAARIEGKSTDTVDVTFKGYSRDAENMFGYQVSNVIGVLRANSEDAQKVKSASGNATHFEKTNAYLYYIRKFSPVSSLFCSVNGQWSWGRRNLDSSEDFYIAGPNAVRAFTSGEASGDIGVAGTLEYRYDTPVEGLQLSAFYDVGYVRYNADAIDDDNSRTLAGAGIGLSYAKSRNYYMKLDLATPLSNKYSRSYGKDNNYMVWFRFTKQL